MQKPYHVGSAPKVVPLNHGLNWTVRDLPTEPLTWDELKAIEKWGEYAKGKHLVFCSIEFKNLPK